MDEHEWKWLRQSVEPKRKEDDWRHHNPYKQMVPAPHSQEMVTKAFQMVAYVLDHPDIHKPQQHDNDGKINARSCFYRHVTECIDQNKGWILFPDDLLETSFSQRTEALFQLLLPGILEAFRFEAINVSYLSIRGNFERIS